MTQFPEQISSNNDLLIGLCYNSRNSSLFSNNDSCTSVHNVLYWTTNVVTKNVVSTETLMYFNKADIASIKKGAGICGLGF